LVVCVICLLFVLGVVLDVVVDVVAGVSVDAVAQQVIFQNH